MLHMPQIQSNELMTILSVPSQVQILSALFSNMLNRREILGCRWGVDEILALLGC
jgi:hypothetical protein